MTLITSLFIGFSIAAIPGPIFFELVRRTLARGLLSGVLLAIGEFIGNFLLLSAIFFGVSNYLTNQFSKIILSLAGAAILLWLGITALRLKMSAIEKSYKKELTDKNSVFVGFGIAVTSPIVIALWISLSKSYLEQFGSHTLAFTNIFLVALGFLLFFIPLAGVISYTRRRISPHNVVILSKVFGLILITYGSYFLYQFALLLRR